MSGLTKVGSPWRYVIIGLAALALIAVIVLGVKSCKEIDQANDNVLVNAGADRTRVQTQGEVLNHVQSAQNAVSSPSAAERNVVCSKYDRNCAGGGK